MSDTSARANRFAFWFGSLARNGLIGAFDGVAAVVSDRAAGAAVSGLADTARWLVGSDGRGNGDGDCAVASGMMGRAAGAPIGTSLVRAASGGGLLGRALWPTSRFS